MKIIPRTFPGSLCQQNYGTLCWTGYGLIAYAANNVITIVNSLNLEVVTTLHSHRSPVTKISLASNPVLTDDHSSHIFLASADSSGYIVIFDVTKARAIQRLSENNKVVNDLELFYTSSSDLHLLSLHQSATLILWNPHASEQIWKTSLSDNLNTFARNPFNQSQLVLSGSRFVHVIEDFSTSQPPSDGQRLYLTQAKVPETNLSPTHKDKKFSYSEQKSNLILSADPKLKNSSDDDPPIGGIIQKILYHQTHRNTIILQYQQDILMIDLSIKQTVGAISLDRSTCPFVQIYPCRIRDAVYCLHENGAVIFRIRKSDVASANSLSYESHCTSDGLRITKSQRIFGLAVCPSTERKVAIITSEGKLLLWKLEVYRNKKLDDEVLTLTDCILSSLSSRPPIPDSRRLTFFLSAISTTLSNSPYIVKMCPPLTTKNFHLYQPFLAVGSVSGMVHIYNVSTGQLEKDLSVHQCQVRGIEWASLHSIISHASEGNATSSKNELMFTNIKTGQVTSFRNCKSDEGVIQLVRVSHLKQYMIIVFKHKPMELWDLRTLSLLREMPTDFPVITALEWSPSPFRKKNAQDVDEETGSGRGYQREHFVFTDNTCLLYHYIVEGSIVKDGSKINAEGVSGTVTSLAWKQECLILGDVNGTLSFWDLKHKKSNNVSVHKGMVRKIKYAPGKENTKILILFNDEVQVWDKNTKDVVSSLKFPKEIGRVSDVDWVNSDKIVLSVSDGYITVTDTSLKIYMSPFSELTHSDDCTLPCLLTKKSRYALRHTLCENRWNSSFVPENKTVAPSRIQTLLKQSSIVDRCYIVALLFGDSFAQDFWSLCKSKLIEQQNLKQSADDSKNEQSSEVIEDTGDPYLESCFDLFLSSDLFKSMELSRLAVHDTKLYDSDLRRNCADRYILLSEPQKAEHILLETNPESPHYYTDSLRACLLASEQNTEASQTMMKLIATGLIAHGKIQEGVELLCHINKGLDACRYLQSYNKWKESAWLAKVRLNEEERSDIFSRWINEHLTSPLVNDKKRAVLAALSINDYIKASELLYGMQCFSMAAMFIQFITESQLFVPDENNAAIVDAVYAQYARVLKYAGVIDGAAHYAEKAGVSGSKLLEEIRQEDWSQSASEESLLS